MVSVLIETAIHHPIVPVSQVVRSTWSWSCGAFAVFQFQLHLTLDNSEPDENVGPALLLNNESRTMKMDHWMEKDVLGRGERKKTDDQCAVSYMDYQWEESTATAGRGLTIQIGAIAPNLTLQSFVDWLVTFPFPHHWDSLSVLPMDDDEKDSTTSFVVFPTSTTSSTECTVEKGWFVPRTKQQRAWFQYLQDAENQDPCSHQDQARKDHWTTFCQQWGKKKKTTQTNDTGLENRQ